MSALSQSEMSGLWVQAGGSSVVAGLMAAIAMAESSGNPDAINSDSGACGLWQIHPAQAGCTDPMTNARQAVAKYNGQGLGAWEAYTNGSYQRFSGPSIGTVGLLSASDSGCHTFSAFGNCWDSVVGLSSVILGLTLITVAIILVSMSVPEVKEAVDKTKQTAETAAQVALVVVPK